MLWVGPRCAGDRGSFSNGSGGRVGQGCAETHGYELTIKSGHEFAVGGIISVLCGLDEPRFAIRA